MAIRDVIQLLTQPSPPAPEPAPEKTKVAESNNGPSDRGWYDDYLFPTIISGGGTAFTLPEAYIQTAVRDSHWIYDMHGIAQRIVKRVLSIIYEAGLTYSITFDDGVEDNETLKDAAIALRRRLDRFWYDEDNDIQSRGRDFVLEALLSGEHGWELESDDVGGTTQIFDFLRSDVAELHINKRDRRALDAVKLTQSERVLNTIRINRDPSSQRYMHLDGQCMYFRFGFRPSSPRGKPLLMAVIDELKAEKKFRVLVGDRVLARLAQFMDTKLTGMDQTAVDEYAKKAGTRIPTNGNRFFHNEQVENQFLSSNLEAGEVVALIQVFLTVILGSFGHPLSWYGFGNDTNRATAESQQGPAELDSKADKLGFIGMVQKALAYAADSLIVAGVILPGVSPLQKFTVKDIDGNDVEKLFRDCFTITVSPVPLATAASTGKPLEATAAAMDVITKDRLAAAEGGAKMLSAEDELALLNYAMAKDGIGIVLVAPEEEAAPTPPAA